MGVRRTIAGLCLLAAGCGDLLGVGSSDDAPPPVSGDAGAPDDGGPVGADGSILPSPDGGAVDAEAGAGSCASTCNSGFCTNGLCDPLVFVTSVVRSGSLPGLGGTTGIARARSLCNTLASAAGLSGTFEPWLSAPGDVVKDRLADVGRPYRRRDGVIVAANLAAFASTLESGITLDEMGNTVNGFAWTGTSKTGDMAGTGQSCTSWSIGDNTAQGVTGFVGDKGAGWTEGSDTTCLGTHHVYCFELLAQ